MTSSGTSDDQKREAAAALEELPDDQPEDIRAKELAFRRHEQTEEYRLKKQLADAWCAAFVIKKQFREPSREDSVSDITHGRLNKLADGRPLTTDLAAEVERLSDQYEFFHWHLAFPEVFAKGGFARTRKSACAVSPRNSRGCSTFWGATPRLQSAALRVRVRRSSPWPRHRTPPGVECARSSFVTTAR
jgi:hypothetical protein